VEEGSVRLPEERQFKYVLIGVAITVALFALAFVVLTVVKSSRSPQDITANWFVAWGTWAGGLGTAAAFLIAAFSISVASAHSRFHRRQAVEPGGRSHGTGPALDHLQG
jgi:pheromone shutdown protein TraB